MRLIAAVAKNNMVGQGLNLPWYYPDDLAYFKSKTKGKTIIIGRKTWESFQGKPLTDRKHIILSSTLEVPGVKDVYVTQTPDAAAFHARETFKTAGEDVWVCGGASTYSSMWRYVDELYITRIPERPPENKGSSYFPHVAVGQIWYLSREERAGDLRVDIYKRR